ncbi:leucine-rich repeat-containing protein egg-6-like [Ixodes scapularis]|uniref:leucine-rich repeat-containing protein egg-6-like n=1 Tax=Ixodes scapularis TaxID=6945 RepID=UPI001A9F5FE4|nr:leucine-rich repeat-containing protein egg-6-like [Ixodes scapularis]
MPLRELEYLFIVVVAVAMMLTVARKTTSRFKTTCPVLYHCSCYIYRNKAVVKCPGGRKQSMNADQLTSDLARFASTEMDEVTVDHFRFTTLPANLARNLTMTSLIITNGPLDAMDDECFEGVLAMDKLIVERTKLKMVPGAVLRLGSKLRELRLANNSIESVGDVLRTLVNLEKLDLDSNAIESLDESLFNNLGLLKELRLGNNKLHRLPIESLKIPPLEIVELHNNALTEETANAFGSFHRLKVG